MSVTRTVMEVLSDFVYDSSTIKINSRLEDDLGLDEYDLIDIVDILCDEFDIVLYLDEDKINFDMFPTVASLVEFVKKNTDGN